MILVNGQNDNRINVQDRGMQYGDGLFETIALRQNQLEFLDCHLKRLVKGCERLNIPPDFLDGLKVDLELFTSSLEEDSVIKIIITRGEGGRGYRSPEEIKTTRIVSSHPIPVYPESFQQGVNVRSCQQRISENISLAGIKHLNRLEQVLACSEWNDPRIAEGLMFNSRDELIEGTMSNVFLVKDKSLVTPVLNKSGVAGIIRQQVMSLAKTLNIKVLETSITIDALKQADEVFLTNSIINIWPVINVHNQFSLDYGDITKRLQNALKSTNK